MTKAFSRRGFLSATGAAALTSLAGAAHAEPPTASLRPVARGEDVRKRLQASAEELIARARLNGPTGFAVLDVGTGETLEAHEPRLGLPPASVAKALTASYALDHLGPEHRFTTRLIATGGITDGVVAGDLVLVGGGDPTLDTDGLAEMAKAMGAAGITSVEGRFLVCGTHLTRSRSIDPAQPAHVGYNPAVSGLNLNFNRVHFEWRRGGDGYDVTMDARSGALRPAVRMASMGVVSRKGPVYTYDDVDGRDEWTVARGALGQGGARWLPVRKPELYAGEVFQVLAGAERVTLRAPELIDTPPEGETVASRESAPLREILRDMLKWSTNLTAEVVGLSATRVRLGRPVALQESAAEMNAWARETLGLENVALIDHSGLGDRSRIAAVDMARALVAVRGRLELKPLLKEISVKDDARRAISDHPATVRAKTGTLNFVSGLAGFIDMADGTEMAFAIFSGDLDRRAALTRAQRERPDGARAWNARAKILQQALIRRWGVMHGS
ncbi:D-alanyl-D-alanine carboxypeptidase/D-alanyl-D-alanine endopeptidase [Salipiger mucosus]|uniref:D-alanyl-D-alanine carboxypeptidase n=1 Tax=Salipiger mucosus DSM 16094 TaxID=1123237 RepID=S9S986_9RHOB|nr:D-alanyl-D-alanine carboxypeptidase/D-alanyl-D-alanine-endopeptidase [Salipiger mucosus]EPX86720.1 D-alanyl-D-alanine carboxypeptidase [Salipiger mucosus DSM 16094]